MPNKWFNRTPRSGFVLKSLRFQRAAPVNLSLGGSGFSGVLRVGFVLLTSMVAVRFRFERFVYCQLCVCVMHGVASGVLV